MVRLYFIAPAIMLAMALLHMPYGYYQLLRLVVTFCAGLLTVVAWKDRNTIAAGVFGLTVLIYNPVLPIAFPRSIWWWINVATIAVFLGAFAVFTWQENSRPGLKLRKPPV